MPGSEILFNVAPAEIALTPVHVSCYPFACQDEMRTALTEVQTKLLAIIERYIAKRGFSPSYEEMMKEMGLRSKGGVHRIVHQLLAQGKLRTHKGNGRNLEIGCAMPNRLPTFALATIQWAEKNGYRVEFKPI
jgi:hypothetical protein